MTPNAPEARLRLADPAVRNFAQLLVNVLMVSVTNFTVWFAITFFVYLETRSVFATGVLSGIFLVATALTGIWFGSLVDHHRKKSVMQASAAVSASLYAACLVLYLVTPGEEWGDPASGRLWLLICLLMAGVIAGNPRTIALPTVVTVLFDEARRARANGLVGTATGISFLVTSVISGLLVGAGGMLPVLLLAVVVLGISLVHLQAVRMPEGLTEAAAGEGDHGVDLRGTIRVVRGIPGMFPLIFFTTLNNLLGGALMALTDPYGLSMMSVETWGIAWGGLSTLMIIGGLTIARTGVSSNPVRLVLLVNLALWTVTFIFPMYASVVLLLGGLAVYMFLIPFVEAAEQTVLQKVVPYERQGRVFGFAQSVEQSASPLTAFLISPLAQFVFMPFMTDGAGARLLGGWLGTGPMRGVALLLMIAAVLGFALTVVALTSKQYRLLSRRYREAEPVGAEPEPVAAQPALELVTTVPAPVAGTPEPGRALEPECA
ncbi:MAG: MFS transporter [Streptosporangiales bacterium]|nr:MFS transporter [Streptosporangiales bacterium]